MTKSISEDLRSRVIAAVDGGLSRRAAGERFGVAAASAVRWVREWRESGSTRAKPQGGDMRSRRIEGHRENPERRRGASATSAAGSGARVGTVQCA